MGAGGVGKCPTCGETVGGQAYNKLIGTGLSSEQTAEAEIKDETKHGHALGAISPDFQKARAERELGALQVALARFITHASLAIGKSRHDKYY